MIKDFMPQLSTRQKLVGLALIVAALTTCHLQTAPNQHPIVLSQVQALSDLVTVKYVTEQIVQLTVLDDNLREDFEERAGIIEFDAMLPRGHAECLALLDVLRRHPAVLMGVITLRIELDGKSQCLLTTDVNYARMQLVESGAVEIGTRDLGKWITEEFGGLAMLTTMKTRGK